MATDQEIRDAGFKYIPQQKYLQNPFKIPVAPAAPVINQGIVNTDAFVGGGNDGFSVYNADPNTISNMNPNMNALQDARYDNELSYVGSPGSTVQTDYSKFSTDPTAQLTGKGKLDPMGSGFYNLMMEKAPTYTPSFIKTDADKKQFSSMVNTKLPISMTSGYFNPKKNIDVNKTFFENVYQDPREQKEYGTSPLYSTKTEAIKNMERYPGYYGMDTIGDRFKLDEKGQLVKDDKGNYIRKNQPSKISQLLKKGIGFFPGIGTLSRFGDFASGLLPVNRRAIMENQLGAQGVMVNDIGQIVVGQGGQYNTPEGIMAGYNANQMTEQTFIDRQDVMRNTLDEKYDLSKEQIDGLIAGSLTDEEMEEINDKAYNKITGRTSDIINMIRNVEIAKNNFKDVNEKTDDIVDIKTDTKNNTQGDGGGGIDISNAGTIRSSDNNFQGDSGPTSQQEEDYGYASDYGFAYGGLASLL